MIINVRRLAALDLAVLGPALILSEFALGVVGPAALGTLTLRRSHSAGGTLFGRYLLLLGVNYIPLLCHAVDLWRHGTAEAEIADEPGDRREVFRRYRRQSLFLLIPILVPVVALVQELQRRRE